jgi:coenzyme F420-0:L-glutamate ligase/coenzyme F420-1:gamma-L-glutamate ligase
VSLIPKTLLLTALAAFPVVTPGDDLAQIITQGVESNGLELNNGDVLVLAQKIVSKAEDRFVDLNTIKPTKKAVEIAEITQKDARFVEMVLQESQNIIRVGLNTLIVEHKRGFICANAGIDHSNVKDMKPGHEDWVLLLPENADSSAEKLRLAIKKITSKNIGVLIIDSHGRAWRNGVVGITIGLAGLPGLIDSRGEPDLFGFKLRVTTIGAADELAAAASLIMGQAAEGTPVVHVRGFPYALRDASLKELLRPIDQDLFR